MKMLYASYFTCHAHHHLKSEQIKTSFFILEKKEKETERQKMPGLTILYEALLTDVCASTGQLD